MKHQTNLQTKITPAAAALHLPMRKPVAAKMSLPKAQAKKAVDVQKRTKKHPTPSHVVTKTELTKEKL